MHRNLSLKGKVLLVNALMASILQYPSSAVSTPVRVLVEYKKIILDFFWNYKWSKVAYNLLIQDIGEGGIKFPDITTRIKTSHLYWIKYLWAKPESLMALVIRHLVGYDDVHQLIESNLDQSSKIPSSYPFIKAIMSTWNKLHSTELKKEEEVQEQAIWSNRHILVQREPVRWQRWKNVGICHINDLIHDALPRFLSHTELGEKFGIAISFLELLQIRTAIPCRWKRLIQSPAKNELQISPSILTQQGDRTAIVGTSTKKIYYTLVRFLKPAITSQGRWNELFPKDEHNANEYWADIYKTPYKAIRDTKLQAFAYRLIHRFIPCNRYLCNIRIRTDDTCSFCQAVDTIQHFLFECQMVQAFWSKIVAWFDREVDLDINVTMKDFLFGVSDTQPNAKVMNFVLIFTKFFIYRQKLFHRGSLEMLHFLREFRTRLQVEKYLTTLEGKQQQFRRWNGIYSALG